MYFIRSIFFIFIFFSAVTLTAQEFITGLTQVAVNNVATQGGRKLYHVKTHAAHRDDVSLIPVCVVTEKKLQGNDNDLLKEPGLKRWYAQAKFVKFYVLPQGDYSVEVSTQNENGTWRKTAALYQLRIIPGFWKTTVFIVITASIALLFVSFIFYVRIKYIRLKNDTSAALLNYRQQALAGQINPHFLHNALNSIQAFIMTDDKRSASKYLSGFSKLMRRSLDHSRQEMVSIASELALIETYVSLEKLRFNNKFRFRVFVAPTINKSAVFIPSMILQPYIENAILHGIHESDKTNLVVGITFELKGKVLRVSVQDNGVGIEFSLQRKEQHVSLSQSAGSGITADRLRILCKSMRQPFYLEIRDRFQLTGKNSGTVVTFNLPYKFYSDAVKSDLDRR